MQLVDQKKSEATRKNWSRLLYAALVDSMCQNFLAHVYRLVLRRRRRLDDGTQDREWPCFGRVRL